MNYRKILQAFALLFVFISSSAQAVDFRILYEWVPGPNGKDILKLYVQSTDSLPITKTAVNFSIVYRSTCETVDSFGQIFSGLWGTTFEGLSTNTVLPVPINYDGINYDRRIQYGNFGFGGITIPAVQDPPLQFGTVVFTRTCPDFPYVEDEGENRLNQWQGPLGPCTYEVIPIVVLPEGELAFDGYVDGNGMASLNWVIGDPDYITNVELYREGENHPIFTNNPDSENEYTYTEALQEGITRYQLWLETVEGDRFPSKKLQLEWYPNGANVDVFPLPASSILTTRWQQGAPSDGKLLLYDPQGRIAAKEIVKAEASSAAIRVDKLPAGNYVLVWAGENRFAKPIIISH